jgi:hypothetical protein
MTLSEQVEHAAAPACPVCGGPLPVRETHGRQFQYCDTRCRKTAFRRRRGQRAQARARARREPAPPEPPHPVAGEVDFEHTKAACNGHDPEWWSVGEQATSQFHHMLTHAVALCISCPVRQGCLAEGLGYQDEGVVRGGHLLRAEVGSQTVVPVSLICPTCTARPLHLSPKGLHTRCSVCKPADIQGRAA